MVVAYRPAFSGSSDRKLRPNLAGFVRWNRITLTGAGGFTTRQHDDVERGLDAEVIRRGKFRANLSLRLDNGRNASDSVQLAGLGDIEPTLRGQLSLRWAFAPLWQMSLAANGDLLGKQGGVTTGVGLSRTLPIDARQRLILSAAATLGNSRYMQTWYGVSPSQGAASGLPVYEAGAGWRDIGGSAIWRVDFNPDWAGFCGVSASRLLGPAAASPLAFERSGATWSAALVRRF